MLRDLALLFQGGAGMAAPGAGSALLQPDGTPQASVPQAMLSVEFAFGPLPLSSYVRPILPDDLNVTLGGEGRGPAEMAPGPDVAAAAGRTDGSRPFHGDVAAALPPTRVAVAAALARSAQRGSLHAASPAVGTVHAAALEGRGAGGSMGQVLGLMAWPARVAAGALGMLGRLLFNRR